MVEDGPVNGVGPGISLGYEFDAVGNLWKLRDGKQAEPPLRVYAYDGLERLTAARDAAGTDQQTYAYDRTGNRTASGYWQVTGTADCSGVPPGDPCTPGEPVSTWKTRTYDYVPQKHHLWTIGYTERHYDATGNTIWIGPKSVEQPPGDGDPGPGDPGGGETESAAYAGTEQSMIGLDDGTEPPPGIVEKTFVYNAANRLASVSDGGVLTMSYRYNGAGERVYRTGSDKTVHTVFDPAGHWIGDYDGYGQPLQQAIWLGDLPVGLVARIDGVDRLFYVEPDALGSPRVVIDPTRDAANGGMAVWRWPLTGDAFGEEAPYEDPDGDGTAFVLDLRFPGQQYDSATGFNYNYFRDYDPSTGRYVQSDPIGFSGGISTYAYVKGAPLSNGDPAGLMILISALQPVEGESFSDNVKRRKEFINSPLGRAEATLRSMGEYIQELINKRCAEDRRVLQPIFDRWQVRVDPEMDSLLSNGTDFAMTVYSTKTTTFYRSSFLVGSDVYTVAIHEFRHLFKSNYALYSPNKEAYLRALIRGKDVSDFPHEVDADDFAKKFFNSNCGCSK